VSLLPAIQQFILLRSRTGKLLFFVSGALTMLSFAPVGWYLAAPILLLPFLYVCLYLPAKRAAGLGFWYGSGLFLTGTYWLYTSIHVFGQAPLWVAIVIMLSLVMIMGLYYALTAWLICRLSAGSPLRFFAAAPTVWVAVEWVRGWFLSGFPWMSLGYSQIDSPLAGFAPVIGVYGLSLVLLISVSALVVTSVANGTLRAVAAAAIFLPWFGGALLQQHIWTMPAGPDIKTTIVQGGVSQDRKWLPDQFWPTLNLYRASIDAHPQSDLIIWPEVALPTSIDQVEGYLNQLENEVRRGHQSLLLGILERQPAEETIYNSMLLLGTAPGESRQVYRKRHLVPFGEYFPVPAFVRNWMRMMSLPTTDLGAGADRQPLLVTAAGNKLAVAICYEDAYGAEQLYAMPEADILVNVSNDAWFGDSIAPHQHLEIARMRALEVGRFAVRATNNGVSAFIGPDGAILERGPQFEYVAMTHDITPLGGMTPYARFGNWPVISLCLLAMAGLVYRSRQVPAIRP
jgi:apolipoprotein N-acyltransferase